MMTSVFMIELLLWYWPLNSNFAVRMEVLNECTVLLLGYCMMCFTDFVPEPETRSHVGIFYMGFTAANVLVHIIFLILETSYNLKLRCKRCYNKYITQKNNTANARPVDAAKSNLVEE